MEDVNVNEEAIGSDNELDLRSENDQSDDDSVEVEANNEAACDEEDSDTDFSLEESEDDSLSSISSTSSKPKFEVGEFEEIPDPLANYCRGTDANELEEKLVQKQFELTQERLRAWDLDPASNQLKDEYFTTVHDLMMLPAFARMQKNPYTFDWNGARRAEDNLVIDPVLRAFFVTHLHLSKLEHNIVPHYLQILTLTPSKINLWYELGEKAVRLGDWKNAEFAYRKYMQFNGDPTKALQNIILLHYVSGDFLRTVSALKELLARQSANVVARVIANELYEIQGPWAERMDQVMKQAGILKNFNLNPERVENILVRIQKFKNNRQPKCKKCMHEELLFGQTVHYLELEDKDILFCNFGKRLLQIYKEFSRTPKAFLSITFPLCGNDEILTNIMEALGQPSTPIDTRMDVTGISEEMETDCQDVQRIDEMEETIHDAVEDIQNAVEDIQEIVQDVVYNLVQKVHDIQEANEIDIVEDVQDEHEFELPDIIANDDQKSPESLLTPEDARMYFQVSEFLKQFLDLNQADRWKNMYGWKGLASLFDELMGFVTSNCTTTSIKYHKNDNEVFTNLYQCWHELYTSKLNSTSPNADSIHIFAIKAGCNGALQNVKQIIFDMYKKSNDHIPTSQPTSNLLNMKVDVNAEKASCPNSPSFNGMLRMYERLKQKQIIPMHVDSISTPSSPETIETFPRLLLIFLDKDELKDLSLLEHLLEMRLGDTIDVSSNVDLLKLTAQRRSLMVCYHLEEAKRCSVLRFEQTLVNIKKMKEYKHLLAMFKIVNAHLSVSNEFETTVGNKQQFIENPDILRLLEKIQVDCTKLDQHATRVLLLLKSFARDEVENYISRFEQGDKSDIDKFIELLQSYKEMNGDVKVLLSRHMTIYNCFRAKRDMQKTVNSLRNIFDTLLENSEMREDYLLDYLCKCLDEINFHVENSPDFPWPEIESILKDLTGKSFYRNCVQLWTTYYNVSRRSDPKTTEEFIAFFNETESSDQQRLPTESLMILKKAHNIFGEEKCCMKNEGQFLQFYLNELISTFNSEIVQKALNDTDVYDDDIYRTMNREILQTINCLYKLELSPRFVKSHEFVEPLPKFLKPDWELCEKVLPFFMPETLPLVSEKDNSSSELIELLQKFQKTIEAPLTTELKEEFDRFTEVNKEYRPLCKLDSANETVEMDSTHKGFDLFKWPSAVDLSLTRRTLSAQAFFLLTFREFKTALKSGDEKASEIQQLAKSALLFGKEALHPNQLATLWTIIALQMNYVLEKPDLELFKQMNSLFFHSYMAILMVKTFAETHLDLATAFYKTITRFKRYLANRLNKEFRPEIEETIRDLLPKAEAHFQIAYKFKHDNVEIGWSSTYFLSKIAEKRKAPLLEVMENYQLCSQHMEDNFQFMKKISKSDQGDFEPLELYYSIHSFLNKRRELSFKEENLHNLRKVVRCLELFAEQHISRKSDEKTPNFSIDLRHEMEEVERATDEELSNDPNASVFMSPNTFQKSNLLRKYNNEAEQLCSHAFGKIFSLFPHYKAAYRLAKQLADYNQHKEAADMLFQLFPIKGEINELQQMLKGFVEIENQSFYYSGVLNYHLPKIILLLIECLEKTQDIKRVAYVFLNLLRIHKKPRRSLSSNCVLGMVQKTKDVFARLLTKAYGDNKTISAADHPINFSRLIIYEIDKQLRGSQLDFVDSLHQAVQFIQQKLTVQIPSPVVTT